MKMNGKKIAIGLVLAGLFLAMGGLALAWGPPGGEKPDPQEIERQVGAKLAKLVDAGTITKDQSAKVLEFWREKERERQADFGKTKDMSPDERKAYMDEKMKNRPDMVAELVKNIGLSESQAKAVAEALRPPAPPRPPGC